MAHSAAAIGPMRHPRPRALNGLALPGTGGAMRSSKHDERRRLIAEVVMRVIARDGLDAATVRHIAAEVGFSTTVITHYFSDKDELLLWAYRLLGEYARDGYKVHVDRDPRDLVGYLMAMTATGDANRALWRTYVAILDRSLRDALFAEEFSSWTSAVLGRIETFYRTLYPGSTNANVAARQLLGLVQGLSLQLLFDEQSWSEDACRAALAREIDMLGHMPGE